MGDTRRAVLTRLVYSRLRDHRFRGVLKAVGRVGERPIVVALRDDPMLDLLHQVDAVGGVANVVAPELVDVVDDPDTLVVLWIEICPSAPETKTPDDAPVLRGDCTLGVFLERLHADVPGAETSTYRFTVHGEGPQQCGKGCRTWRPRSTARRPGAASVASRARRA